MAGTHPPAHPVIHVASAPAFEPTDAGSPAVIGVPFRPGELRDAGVLRVRDAGGDARPASARTLVAWPDASTRWALLAFTAASAGGYAVESAGDAAAPPAEFLPVRIERGDGDAAAGSLTLDNGLVRVALAARGPGPIARLDAGGEAFIAAAGDLRLTVDDADTAAEPRRTLTVLEESAVRVRVRIEGGHFRADGSRKLSYRLDVELWAGWPALRLDYHVFNLEPGRDYLDVGRIALDMDLAIDAAGSRRHFLQSHHGIYYEPREVLNPGHVAVVADTERRGAHVEDPAMLLDETDYPHYVDLPLIDTPEWLGASDGRRHVYLHAQDFAAMQPTRMSGQGSRLSFEAWPARAGTLALQQGRSRRHVATLALAVGERPAPAWVSRVTAAPLWEGRATLDPAWPARCGEFEQDRVLAFGRHGRFEKYLAKLVSIETPAAKFDLGDTPDAGYSRSYAGVGMHRQPRAPGAPIMPRVFGAGGQGLATWALPHHYERVWTNNEYDAIHAFACELMRTGKGGLWLPLRWMVRHNIEVDFLHYSDHKWMHRTSPVHSARHSTSGAYPSHFWTQGLMEYYCLTGDPDVLEAAVALGDNILLHFHDPERGKYYRNFDRELGWALLALVHVWDITREPRFRAEIDRLADFFMHHVPAGSATTPSIRGGGEVLNRELVARFYFMINMVEGLDLYARRTGRQDVGEWLGSLLAQMPGAVRRNFREGLAALMMTAALAIGFERSGDRDFLETGLLRLEELIDDDPWWLDPPDQVKPLAILHRELIRFLGQAERAGMLGRFEYEGLRGRRG